MPDTGGGPLIVTPLGNGAVVPALAGAPGSELRFSIDVPPGATDLHIRTSGGSGDPDLYLRYGGLPTQLTHDCRSDTEGTADQCLLERPEAGTHHILVAGFAEYSGVSLSAAHPYGGVSGFLGLCVETPHTSTVRLLSQPSYGIAGARDLRLRVRDARQRELAVVPGS